MSQFATCRISDFGEAISTESNISTTKGTGMPFYMAPEMVTANKEFTKAANVYSFGIIAAQVMVGRLVYANEDEFDTPYRLFFFFPHNFMMFASVFDCFVSEQSF